MSSRIPEYQSFPTLDKRRFRTIRLVFEQARASSGMAPSDGPRQAGEASTYTRALVKEIGDVERRADVRRDNLNIRH